MATQLGSKWDSEDVDDLLNELDDDPLEKKPKNRIVKVQSKGWSDEEAEGEEDGDEEEEEEDSAKQGRRAKKAPEPDSTPIDDTGAEELTTTGGNDADVEIGEGPPKPARRMGGWGEDNTRRRGMDNIEDPDATDPLESAFPEEFDERLRPRSAERSDDDDDEIPTIPDLEDAQEDDLTMQVAMAPNVAVNRVATYRELDNELLRHAAFLTLDNEIDLKILARGLSAEVDVQEDDREWEWDRLFTEVSSELLTEWESKETPEEEVAA